jgi:hypothetical protein
MSRILSVLDTTLWDKTCQWFSPVSPTNTTDRLDIAEILLKVALGIIKQTFRLLLYC